MWCAIYLILVVMIFMTVAIFISSVTAGIIFTIFEVGAIVILLIVAAKNKQKEIEIESKKVLVEDIIVYKKNMSEYMETFEEHFWLREKLQVTIKAEDLKILGQEYENLHRFIRKEEKTSYYDQNIILNMGRKSDKIYFFPTDGTFYAKGSWADKFSIESIPHDIYPYVIEIDNIDYYTQRGERQVYTTTSGGADPAGALVGGVLFGAAGAIIGNSEKVKSQVHVEDTREVVLYYKKDGENQVLHFFPDAFDSFKRVIPEFDMAVKSNRNDR